MELSVAPLDQPRQVGSADVVVDPSVESTTLTLNFNHQSNEVFNNLQYLF
jgi:hypothetical protein